MRTLLVSIAVIFLFHADLYSQTLNDNYDSALAKTFEADDYGMKTYVFVMLRSGSSETSDKAVLDSIFGGHMSNINRLADAGILIVAGPFHKNDKYRGIFILDVKTTEEAKALLETDPAISGKFLEADVYQWYGSAALKEYLKTHEKIEKYTF